MELSNKSLALLLVAAIVVSLGGTLIGLNKINEGITGKVAGRVEVSVTTAAGCVIDQNVSFGSGTGGVLTTLSTNTVNTGFASCLDAASPGCRGLQINNTGNENLYINLTGVNASTFLQGANVQASDFVYYIRNGTYLNASGGCRITPYTGWLNVNDSNAQICTNLTPADGTDIMTIEFNVTLRTDTPTGAKTATLTIPCIAN